MNYVMQKSKNYGTGGRAIELQGLVDELHN